MNRREKEEYLREYELLKKKGKPFFPYAILKDSAMALVVVLVIAAIDGTTLSDVLKQAKAKGITVIAYDRLIRDTPNVDFYATFDNFQVGVLQAQSIEQALGQSRFLILLASPEAAASPWVNKEVAYWLEHKSADTLLVAVTDGVLVWDDTINDFDVRKARPLPPALKGRFAAWRKAMDDAEPMRLGDPLHHGAQQRDDFLVRQRPAAQSAA